MLNGYTVKDDNGVTRCVFCHSYDVSEKHLGLHKVRECYQRAEAERSFARDDLLTQHVRQKHRSVGIDGRNQIFYSDVHDLTSSWERPFCAAIPSCGFCPRKFTDWGLRCQHVARHFIAGQDMTSWSVS